MNKCFLPTDLYKTGLKVANSFEYFISNSRLSILQSGLLKVHQIHFCADKAKEQQFRRIDCLWKT